jgi:hypothetical protein
MPTLIETDAGDAADPRWIGPCTEGASPRQRRLSIGDTPGRILANGHPNAELRRTASAMQNSSIATVTRPPET